MSVQREDIDTGAFHNNAFCSPTFSSSSCLHIVRFPWLTRPYPTPLLFYRADEDEEWR